MQCLRRSAICLCTSAAAGAKSAQPTKSFSFQRRFEELQADPSSAVGGPEYTFLRERLTEYSSLQQQYAVKQSDVERARRAAHMCGLEFTGKGKKKPTKSES